jgi:hypothetical protein
MLAIAGHWMLELPTEGSTRRCLLILLEIYGFREAFRVLREVPHEYKGTSHLRLQHPPPWSLDVPCFCMDEAPPRAPGRLLGAQFESEALLCNVPYCARLLSRAFREDASSCRLCECFCISSHVKPSPVHKALPKLVHKLPRGSGLWSSCIMCTPARNLGSCPTLPRLPRLLCFSGRV